MNNVIVYLIKVNGNKISSKYRGLGFIYDFVIMVYEKKCYI